MTPTTTMYSKLRVSSLLLAGVTMQCARGAALRDQLMHASYYAWWTRVKRTNSSHDARHTHKRPPLLTQCAATPPTCSSGTPCKSARLAHHRRSSGHHHKTATTSDTHCQRRRRRHASVCLALARRRRTASTVGHAPPVALITRRRGS